MIILYNDEIKLCTALLTARGMNKEDAEILASSVAYSDFSGIYSHGLSRFSNYLLRFDNGAYNLNPELSILSDTGATISYSCDDSSGVIAVAHVLEQLKERASKYGIAIATGNNASNIGCGAFFGRMAVEDDKIALICCNTTRAVAPFGGADRFLGTNPVIVAAPACEELPLIMDISTSCVAFGKVQAFKREGKALPAGWALDKAGKPTTDASEAYTVLPIAGPKGYGMAVMIDMFSALLANAAYGDGIGFASQGQKEKTGFAVILIDPSKFMPIEEFKNSVDEYIRTIKASTKADGVEKILLPGELEITRFEKNVNVGYEVSDALAAELVKYAVSFGIASEGATLEEVVKSLA